MSEDEFVFLDFDNATDDGATLHDSQDLATQLQEASTELLARDPCHAPVSAEMCASHGGGASQNDTAVSTPEQDVRPQGTSPEDGTEARPPQPEYANNSKQQDSQPEYGNNSKQDSQPEDERVSEAEGQDNKRISHNLYVGVAGFHHSLGHQVEFSYPEDLPTMSICEASHSTTDLACVCIPDGAHAADTESVLFTLHHGHRLLFGVACLKQVKASEVAPDAAVTRSTVLKSLFVLSSTPLFGIMRERLRAAVEAYFTGGLTDYDVIVRIHRSLAASLVPRSLSDVYFGLSPCLLVRRFRHAILPLFKLMLLSRRVLFFGQSASEVGNILMGLISLLPGYLPSLTWSEMQSELRDDRDRMKAKEWSECGLPLDPFAHGCELVPYTPLQDCEWMRLASGYAAGTTNLLLTNPAHSRAEFIVHCDEGRIEALNSIDSDLHGHSLEDMKYADRIVRSVDVEWDDDAEKSTWEGGDDWVREQFEVYVLALLATATRAGEVDLALSSGAANDFGLRSFGPTWICEWSQTPNYQVWKASGANNGARLASVRARHPAAGDASYLDDLSIRLSNQIMPMGLNVVAGVSGLVGDVASTLADFVESEDAEENSRDGGGFWGAIGTLVQSLGEDS